MRKKVRAVMPYIRKGIVNFKMGPYEAWKNIGGETAVPRYPCFTPASERLLGSFITTNCHRYGNRRRRQDFALWNLSTANSMLSPIM